MKEIDPAVATAFRPSIKINGEIAGEPQNLKSAEIEHANPILPLKLEIGNHPSNLYASIGIQMQGVQWYQIFFTAVANTLLVSMIKTSRSADGQQYWGLVKQSHFQKPNFVLPEVEPKVDLRAPDDKKIGIKTRKFEMPDEPLNPLPEIFLCDKNSGLRFRMIRVYNLPLTSTTADVAAMHYEATVAASEKLADRLEKGDEKILLEATFFNSKRAKSLGDGIARLGINLLEEKLGI